MGLIVMAVVGIVLLAFLIFLFSDRDTRLMRRIWAAKKIGNFDAVDAAVEEILRRHDLYFIGPIGEVEQKTFIEDAAKLTAKAIAFDMKFQNNLGVTVSDTIQAHVAKQLRKAGLSDTEIEGT